MAPGPRERHAGHARRSAPPVEGGRPAQRDDQGARPRPRACPPSAPCSARASTSTSPCCSRSEAYEGVAARLRGRHRGARRQGPATVDRVASVASFFVSRIDSAVDALLEEKMKTATGADKARMLRPAGQGRHRQRQGRLPELQGDLLRPALGGAGQAKGAQTQRVLWASTGTKNPSYRDVVYVEELIGPATVNTVPPGHVRRLPRPRQAAAEPGGGRRRARWTSSTTSRSRGSPSRR